MGKQDRKKGRRIIARIQLGELAPGCGNQPSGPADSGDLSEAQLHHQQRLYDSSKSSTDVFL